MLNFLRSLIPGLSVQVGDSELRDFFRELHTMHNAGLSIPECLETLIEAGSYLWAEDIMEKTAQGMQFSHALREEDYIDDDVADTVAIGEESGELNAVLKRMYELYDIQIESQGSIMQEMIYPAFVLVALAGFLTVLGVWVIPTMEEVMDQMKGGEGSLGFTEWFYPLMQIGAPIIGALMVLVPVGAYITYRYSSNVQKLVYNTPGLRAFFLVSQLVNIFPYARIMYSSGLRMHDVFERLADRAELEFPKSVLNDMANNLASGVTLSELIKKHDNFFPPFVRRIVVARERSGELEKGFEQIEEYYFDKLQTNIETFVEIMNPIFVFGTAIIIVVLLVSVMFPMYTAIMDAAEGGF